MNIQLTDLYRILRNAVRFFPQAVPVKMCAQLQTFRVLQRDPRTNAEVGTDNMGAVPIDKDSPFFWSRKWELAKNNPNDLSYNYPVLTAFELYNETNGDLLNGTVSRMYSIELAVLDKYVADVTKGSGRPCESRSINQIFLDTELLLDAAIKYLGGSVVALTNVDPVEKIYFKPFLESAKLAGDIVSFEVRKELGPIFGADNRNLRFVRVEYPGKNLFGTKVQLKMKVHNCPTIDFTSDVPDLGIVGFEIGCRTC